MLAVLNAFQDEGKKKADIDILIYRNNDSQGWGGIGKNNGEYNSIYRKILYTLNTFTIEGGLDPEKLQTLSKIAAGQI